MTISPNIQSVNLNQTRIKLSGLALYNPKTLSNWPCPHQVNSARCDTNGESATRIVTVEVVAFFFFCDDSTKDGMITFCTPVI